MGRTFSPLVETATLTVAMLVTLHASTTYAQTAFRCDSNGQTIYSDKPCPPDHRAKAVTTSQDSAEQRAASQAANAQMRKDDADLNKRLTEREKLEAKERADARKAARKAKSDAAKSKTAKGSGKAKGAKPKTLKAPLKKKTKPANNSVLSNR